jgi:asparagine synthase (glutamine-hydrolysing)
VAATGISTLLTGAGVGDWILRPIEDKLMVVRHLPSPLLGLAGAAVPVVGLVHPTLARRANTFLNWCRAEIPLAAMTPVMSAPYRRRIYRMPTLADSGQQAANELLEAIRRDIAAESAYDQFIFLRQRLFIAECNLFWNSAWARAQNLAVRHPYYDNELQEFVMRLLSKAPNKSDLRRYAATVLPREKAYARKIYHTIPLEHWFRGPLQGFLRDQLSAERLNRQGLFEPRAVGDLIDQHVNGQAVHTWRLLGLLTATVWYDAVLKGVVRGISTVARDGLPRVTGAVRS